MIQYARFRIPISTLKIRLSPTVRVEAGAPVARLAEWLTSFSMRRRSRGFVPDVEMPHLKAIRRSSASFKVDIHIIFLGDVSVIIHRQICRQLESKQ
jgi:hypothetical protein